MSANPRHSTAKGGQKGLRQDIARLKRQVTRLQTGGHVVDAINGAAIAPDSITTVQLAADSVVAENILAGTIGANHIGANSITAGHLQANSVTAAAIQAGTITAGLIQAGAIEANLISTGGLTAAAIATGTITATQMNVGNVRAAVLTAGSITASMLQADTAMANQLLSTLITSTSISTSGLSAVAATMGTVTGGIFRTSAAAATPKVAMGTSIPKPAGLGGGTMTGILGLDSSDNVTLMFDAATGNVEIKGTIKSGSTGLGNLSGSLVSGQIPTGAAAVIDGNRVVADSITTRELSATSITAIELTAGNARLGKLKAGAVDAASIVTGALDAQVITGAIYRSNSGVAWGSGTGLYISDNGLRLLSGGSVQIELNNNGTATFSGALSGASGTFSGSLSSATGTFAGSLSAVTGSFGNVTATGTITGGTLSGSTISGGYVSGSVLTMTTGSYEPPTINFVRAGSHTMGQFAAWQYDSANSHRNKARMICFDAGAFVGNARALVEVINYETSEAFTGAWATAYSFGMTAHQRLIIGGQGGSSFQPAASDAKLKDRITWADRKQSVAKLRQLRAAHFTWNETGEDAFGLIAQEVEKVLPEAISEIPEAYSDPEKGGVLPTGKTLKHVDLRAVAALLVDMVNDLDERLDVLEAKGKK